MASAPKAHRVRAVVRIRPLLTFESRHKSGLLEVGGRPGDGKAGQSVVLKNKPGMDAGLLPSGDAAAREFKVDAVFQPASTQQDVFEGCNIKSMIMAVCKGYK